MASPELLGISSGTALGVLAAVLLFDVQVLSSVFWFIGISSALFTLWLIMLFNREKRLAARKSIAHRHCRGRTV